MYKILHIAAHYGGGVGSIVNAWTNTDKDNIHTLTYLSDLPENKKENHRLFDISMVNDHDIVLVHVWNHPMLFQFLTTVNLPPCRLIGWSHMSGLNPPYVLFRKLVNYFDEFYYTSPVSNLSGIENDFVWSTCDIDKFLKIKKKKHKGFNVGYIGTLDYCKLHPDFIKICEKIDIPGVYFTVVGHGSDLENMKKEVKQRGLENKFVFTGIVKDTIPYLSEFDVFLYPLNEKHFGTCEQVIGEAMAAGVPCVSFNNHAEEVIIKNGVNGFLCDTKEDIVQIIFDIYNGSIEYNETMLKGCAIDIYSISKKISKWNSIFDGIIKKEKPVRYWRSPGHIFAESIGPIGAIFDFYIKMYEQNDLYSLENFIIPGIKKIFKLNGFQWQSKSKGSLYHYAKFFPEDKYIKQWIEILCK